VISRAYGERHPKAASVLQSIPRITTLSLLSATADSMGFFNSRYINIVLISTNKNNVSFSYEKANVVLNSLSHLLH